MSDVRFAMAFAFVAGVTSGVMLVLIFLLATGGGL